MIRKLTSEDNLQMLKLMKEFWLDFNREELLTGDLKEIEALENYESEMQSEFEKYLKWESYVLEIDGQIIGFVCAKMEMRTYKVLKKLGYIEELFITKRYRNQGFGSELMEFIIAKLTKEKCDVLGIDAYAMNEPALKLYRKFGFIDKAVVLLRKA